MKPKWGVIINDLGLVIIGMSLGCLMSKNSIWIYLFVFGCFSFIIGLYKIGKSG